MEILLSQSEREYLLRLPGVPGDIRAMLNQGGTRSLQLSLDTKQVETFRDPVGGAVDATGIRQGLGAKRPRVDA